MKKVAILLALTLLLTACSSKPDKQVNQSTGKLTIATFVNNAKEDDILKKTIEEMRKKNNEVEVVFDNLSENIETYDLQLKTKLMSGDSDHDIFMLYPERYIEYIKNDTVENLNNYPDIVNSFNNVFDGVKQNFVYEDRLIGIPLRYSVFVLVENAEVGKTLNVEMPEGNWTWEQFYELAKKAHQDITGDGTPDTYILSWSKNYPLFMREYLLTYVDFYKGKVSFDNVKLVRHLKLWKRMWDEGLIKVLTGYETDHINTLFSQEAATLSFGEQMIVCMPTIDSEKVYLSMSDIMCINKNSKNKELAAEFLNTFLSREVQGINPLSGALYKDRSIYKEIDKSLIEAGIGGPLSNEKNFRLYEELMKHSKMGANHMELHFYIMEVIKKFMENEISAEKAAENIEQKAKMIVEE